MIGWKLKVKHEKKKKKEKKKAIKKEQTINRQRRNQFLNRRYEFTAIKQIRKIAIEIMIKERNYQRFSSLM